MMGHLEIWTLFLAFWSCGPVFSYPMEKRKHFDKIVPILSVFVMVVFGLYVYVLRDGEFVNGVLVKNIANLLMFIFIYSCWEISFSTAIYNTIWAVSLWQLLFELWTMAKIVFGAFFLQHKLVATVVMIFVFVFGHVICAYTIAKWMDQDRKKRLGPRQTLSAILLFVIIETLSYAPALQSIETYNADWKFLYLSQMMCIIILYLQNELFKKSEIKQELDLMNLLWKKEQEQYKLAKENITIINQKSHDLKHQIKSLRKASKEEFNKYLDEMEESVQIYEAIVKTGNDVFDTILTEKSLYCKERGIQVSCVADGSQMGFINTVDLYALLGNAMDNAIEAVEKFREIEKRQIDVLIYRQQNFLVMNIINPIAGKLVYEEELPVTTKGDRKFHGFGLRSMWYIVKKYDGYLNINEEDGCFSLKILMPIPSNG